MEKDRQTARPAVFMAFGQEGKGVCLVEQPSAVSEDATDLMWTVGSLIEVRPWTMLIE